MKIGIITTKDSVNHKIDEAEAATNDEICRAIVELEQIKQELISWLSYDYEIFKERWLGYVNADLETLMASMSVIGVDLKMMETVIWESDCSRRSKNVVGLDLGGLPTHLDNHETHPESQWPSGGKKSSSQTRINLVWCDNFPE